MNTFSLSGGLFIIFIFMYNSPMCVCVHFIYLFSFVPLLVREGMGRIESFFFGLLKMSTSTLIKQRNVCVWVCKKIVIE